MAIFSKKKHRLNDCFLLKEEPHIVFMQIKYMMGLTILLHGFILMADISVNHQFFIEKKTPNAVKYNARNVARVKNLVARIEFQHKKFPLILGAIARVDSNHIALKSIAISSAQVNIDGQVDSLLNLYQWRTYLTKMWHKECSIGSHVKHDRFSFHLSCQMGLQE